ncbi:hypothetical protein [Undibacterium sp. TS12]|uniref:hypothetical protein n=1 Tax=Undibacterium sp. TS12 TaxID=2908202 RepID=UPI001F4D2961|nr:hypothetical protein [Undibacterium sp. TS12]MCH8620415.1 hypothetical protein [Undibacterium sp. TS12]
MKPLYWLKKIPVLGTLIWLANCYSYGGDARSGKEFAPVKLWVKAFFPNLFSAIVLTLITVPDFAFSLWEYFAKSKALIEKLNGIGATPGAMIVSIFPNLLGLGIGIYALLFALDASFVRQFHHKLEQARREGKRQHGSVLILNSDIAFPLCNMVVIVAVGVVSQAFPNNLWTQLLSWIALWYGLVLVLEIIALLFLLIDNTLLEKADIENPKKHRIILSHRIHRCRRHNNQAQNTKNRYK